MRISVRCTGSLDNIQLFERAVQSFDSALLLAADSVRLADLARVGKGRALLNLGRFAEAAQAVAAVPTAYVYDVIFVATALHNGLYTQGGTSTQPNREYSVPNSEGVNGINWRTAQAGAPDPRAAVINRSPAVIGLDNTTQVWQFAQYQSNTAPMRLASGIEARLIEAEAALQAGDASTWLSIHNALRATVTGLGALSDPGNQAARVDLHFRERAFWLFLTGHRHGDLRRLVRQYGRAAESVFPTGQWRAGIAYGAATNLAPEAGQFNNPNYQGCLNRDP